MTLREATAADLGFIMETERLPGYERVVGRWTSEQHLAEMALPSSCHLIFEEGGARAAFAILQTLDDANGNIYLKRIAVARQGEGVGGRAMRSLQDWVFALPHAHRFHLHYAAINERGQRLYAATGFRHEGREREVYLAPDGTRVDSVRVSILRHEWAALRAV